MKPRFKGLRVFWLAGAAVAAVLASLSGASSGSAQAPAIASKPPPARESPFTNSLGMKFVAVPGTKVWFCVWLTRVRDFEAFVKESRYKMAAGRSFHHGWRWVGDTWNHPGFDQTGDHPVCLVTFQDAQAFCDWLTGKELAGGFLKKGQTYRLPSDAEWRLAAGPTKYPWGDDYPPPPGAGNFAGEEVKGADWLDRAVVNRGYNDGYPRTSPVGSFLPNTLGLFDMAGNLLEWCDNSAEFEDRTKSARQSGKIMLVTGMPTPIEARGSSWAGGFSDLLLSSRTVGSPAPDTIRQYGNLFPLFLSTNSVGLTCSWVCDAKVTEMEQNGQGRFFS